MANFIVTNTNGSGTGSLSDAIAQANANADADTITFAASLSGQTVSPDQTLTITGGTVTINGDIDGDGDADVTISDGSNYATVIGVNAGASVTLDALAFANGTTNGLSGTGNSWGNFVTNAGNLTITRSSFADGSNTDAGAPGLQAGAILNQAGGTLTIVESEFSNNEIIGGSAPWETAQTGASVAGHVLNAGTMSLTNVVFENGTAVGGTGAFSIRTSNAVGAGGDAGGNVLNLGTMSGTAETNGGSAIAGEAGFSSSLGQGTDNGQSDNNILNLGTGSITAVSNLGTFGADNESNITGSFYGLSGQDTLSGSAASNLFGGAGHDTLTNGIGGRAFGGMGDDAITGNSGRGMLTGDAGNDSLTGGSGDEVLNGGQGDDVIDGGTGRDRAVYSGSAAVAVDLGLTTAQATGQGSDTITNVEHLTTGSGDDRLTGNAAANSLSAGAGNDTLSGLNGDDTLFGGAGDDALSGGAGINALSGGAGADAFVFDTAPGAGTMQRIADFSVADDTIQLDDAVFLALSTGALDASAFQANTTGMATTAEARIIYETDTGRLFYDANGSGYGERVYLGAMTANLAVTADDFLII